MQKSGRFCENDFRFRVLLLESGREVEKLLWCVIIRKVGRKVGIRTICLLFRRFSFGLEEKK